MIQKIKATAACVIGLEIIKKKTFADLLNGNNGLVYNRLFYYNINSQRQKTSPY